MYQKTGKIVAFPARASQALAPVQVPQATLPADRQDIVSALQTTLHTDKLLPLFFDILCSHLSLAGYEYAHPPLGLSLSGGQRGHCQAGYHLVLESESLGELRFLRQRPFSAYDLNLLELFLSALIYPLRNTLLYQQALRVAHTDALTGVGNRTAFQSGLAREWKAARRHFAPLSLIAVDVDFFKRVNDTYGHPCGDEVLKTVARCIKESTRGSDLVYRYGGEEFMVLLADTGLDGAALLAERLRRHMEASPCPTEHGELRVTVSVGVATLLPCDTESCLLKRADQALYLAKQQGRNRVVAAE